MKKDNVKAMEQQASEVCREFQIFCGYVLQDTVKLAKKSGYISKRTALSWIHAYGPERTLKDQPVFRLNILL